MLKLSIIGCGNVAKTMGYLWHQSGNVEIIDVINRSQQSADKSVAFIGAGTPLAGIDNLQKADVFVIACGDDAIEDCLSDLLKQNIVTSDTIVFHFSGAKSSHSLEKAKAFGAQCASLHPVKSFAEPSLAIRTFANTYCGLEGDDKAREVLETLVSSIGGHCFKVNSDKKLTYHAASVFACNYLTALQELSIKAFEHSGVERDLAMKILAPIVTETTENIFSLGTKNALTGPIARGDDKLVAEQFDAIKQWDTNAANVYQSLGKIALDLADERNHSDSKKLNKIRNKLA